MDEDLDRFIKSWRIPVPSTGFDDRMLEAYRQRMPWWRRWCAMRIEVPLPALAALLVVVLFIGILLVRGRDDPSTQAGGWHPVAEPTLKVIRSEVRD
jgi:hypothetical protein